MKRKASERGAKPPLSGNADHRMRMYSLAAAAASVSALALAQPAEAEIIITNKTIPIHAGTPVNLDLNGDGISDFQFSLNTYTYKIFDYNKLYVNALAGGKVVGKVGKNQTPEASALVRGAKIGPAGPFDPSADFVTIEDSILCTQNCGKHGGYSFDQSLYGNWGGGHPNRFVGVKFLIKGATHYGWARLTVTVKSKGTGKGPKGSFSGTITEYGFESVANKSCSAGLPGASSAANPDETGKIESGKTGASLGMLALGSDGLELWRPEP